MSEMKTQTNESKADKIRALTAQGMKAKDIAATVGTTVQAVYSLRYYDAKKAKAKAKAKQAKKELASTKRISPRTGKPVRKYVKTKSSVAERGAELMRMTREKWAAPAPNGQVMLLEAELDFMRRELDMERARLPKTIEVPVPQPHYNLTWKQRFTALFFGKV